MKLVWQKLDKPRKKYYYVMAFSNSAVVTTDTKGVKEKNMNNQTTFEVKEPKAKATIGQIRRICSVPYHWKSEGHQVGNHLWSFFSKAKLQARLESRSSIEDTSDEETAFGRYQGYAILQETCKSWLK